MGARPRGERRPRRVAVTGRLARQRGQASLEVLALLPVLIGVALAAVYLTGLLAAAGQSQDRARAAAMRATGEAGAVVTVTGASRAAPPVLAGAAAPRLRVRAAVRLP